MKKFYVVLLLSLATAIIFASSVCAEDFKFDYGAAERVREEIWNNIIDLHTLARGDAGNTSRERDFFRFRTSLWGSVYYVDNKEDRAGLFVRLTNEAKEYVGQGKYGLAQNVSQTSGAVIPGTHFESFEEDEIFFDNLYADYKKVFGGPVDIRIGRQELTYGEGFLISEGTPGDGSRSFYFNAAKATVNITPNNSVDLVFIADPKTDIFLPSEHSSLVANPGSLYFHNKRVLNTSNETGAVVYSKNKIGNFNVEPYYIYKSEAGFTAVNGVTTPRLGLNTLGTRLLYDNNVWKAGAEYAHESGEYAHGGIYPNGQARRGNGGYVFGGYNFNNIPLKPYAELRYVYLSGDDQSTAADESWDPLFSRAPYWNELFIYTLINETVKYSNTIPGYWTNLNIYKATVKLNFCDNANLTLAWEYLTAPQTTSGLNSAMFTNNGHDIGNLPTTLLYYKFNKNIDGFVQWEYLLPGNFYQSTAKNASFFRWQLMFKI